MSSSEDRQKKKISIARIILWTVVVLFFLIPYDHGVVKHEYIEGYEISLFSFVVYSNAH